LAGLVPFLCTRQNEDAGAEKALEFLRQALPVQVTLLIVAFVYLIVLIKELAEKFIGVAERQASLADTQARYLQERLAGC